MVLTIAGSDSGGGAGIQADLKVFRAFDCFGTSAITCVTAQNPGEVLAIEPLSPDIVAKQIQAVSKAFPVAAAKTGMLYSVEIIEAVAGAVEDCGIPNLVIDPVTLSSSGTPLLKDDAVNAMVELLFPKATVITPNISEAEMLIGHQIKSKADGAKVARALGSRFDCACVIKGGHVFRDEDADKDAVVSDVLWHDGHNSEFRIDRVACGTAHGTGCTYAAVVAACLALGLKLDRALFLAQAYVSDALESSEFIGEYRVLGSPRKNIGI